MKSDAGNSDCFASIRSKERRNASFLDGSEPAARIADCSDGSCRANQDTRWEISLTLIIPRHLRTRSKASATEASIDNLTVVYCDLPAIDDFVLVVAVYYFFFSAAIPFRKFRTTSGCSEPFGQRPKITDCVTSGCEATQSMIRLKTLTCVDANFSVTSASASDTPGRSSIRKMTRRCFFGSAMAGCSDSGCLLSNGDNL